MTSPTDITERRRKAKKIKVGSKRKKEILKTGTTPILFKLDKPVTTTNKQ